MVQNFCPGGAGGVVQVGRGGGGGGGGASEGH